jgi:hypothetical protein
MSIEPNFTLHPFLRGFPLKLEPIAEVVNLLNYYQTKNSSTIFKFYIAKEAHASMKCFLPPSPNPPFIPQENRKIMSTKTHHSLMTNDDYRNTHHRSHTRNPLNCSFRMSSSCLECLLYYHVIQQTTSPRLYKSKSLVYWYNIFYNKINCVCVWMSLKSIFSLPTYVQFFQVSLFIDTTLFLPFLKFLKPYISLCTPFPNSPSSKRL